MQQFYNHLYEIIWYILLYKLSLTKRKDSLDPMVNSHHIITSHSFESLIFFLFVFEGSDSSTHQNEISFQVPTQSELGEKFSSEAPWTDSTSQDACEAEAPVVQSDEEDVQVDTALVNTETKSPSDVSDESD